MCGEMVAEQSPLWFLVLSSLLPVRGRALSGDLYHPNNSATTLPSFLPFRLKKPGLCHSLDKEVKLKVPSSVENKTKIAGTQLC